MRKYIILIIILLFCPTAFGAKDMPPVTIGTQVWAAANLEVTELRNGDKIIEAESDEEWVKANDQAKPAWCYYDGKKSNGKIYGKIYNWYAIKLGVSPEGWHIPKEREWMALLDYLGGDGAGNKLKGTSEWINNGNGDNSTGFSALPGGYRAEDGKFFHLGKYAHFWFNSESFSLRAWCYILQNFNSDVISDNFNKGCGFSVRCVRDN